MAEGPSSDCVDTQTSNCVEVTVLSIQKTYHYTIPSFSAITLELKRGRIRADDDLYDVFFNQGVDSPDFGLVNLPVQAKVIKACLVDPHEFQKGLDEDLTMEEFNLFQNDVFIIYSWEWMDAREMLNTSDESSEDGLLPDSEIPSEHNELDEFDREKSHTVTFKCIGANRDSSQQNALRVAAENIRTGLNIPVRLNPQPDNPADSNAIAFQCFVQQKWQRVGYVVCEVLPYVHDAVRDNVILSVEFGWVIYYAGADVDQVSMQELIYPNEESGPGLLCMLLAQSRLPQCYS